MAIWHGVRENINWIFEGDALVRWWSILEQVKIKIVGMAKSISCSPQKRRLVGTQSSHSKDKAAARCYTNRTKSSSVAFAETLSTQISQRTWLALIIVTTGTRAELRISSGWRRPASRQRLRLHLHLSATSLALELLPHKQPPRQRLIVVAIAPHVFLVSHSFATTTRRDSSHFVCV